MNSLPGGGRVEAGAGRTAPVVGGLAADLAAHPARESAEHERSEADPRQENVAIRVLVHAGGNVGARRIVALDLRGNGPSSSLVSPSSSSRRSAAAGDVALHSATGCSSKRDSSVFTVMKTILHERHVDLHRGEDMSLSSERRDAPSRRQACTVARVHLRSSEDDLRSWGGFSSLQRRSGSTRVQTDLHADEGKGSPSANGSSLERRSPSPS